MSDLISRQAAIEVLRNRWLKTRNYDGIGEDIAEECEIYLKTLPSAQPTVDAVPVIRCKDCKHWLPHTQFGYDADYDEYHNYCERHLPDDDFYAFRKEAEDYCSWAERKPQ